MCIAAMHAAAEQSLLSRTDFQVVSMGSTFGRTAAMMSWKVTVLPLSRVKRKKRQTSMRHCWYLWPAWHGTDCRLESLTRGLRARAEHRMLLASASHLRRFVRRRRTLSILSHHRTKRVHAGVANMTHWTA